MNKLQRILAVGLCVVAVLAVSAEALTLVKDGQPASVIVTGNNPAPSQKVAAEELQYHLKKMTGAVVPIVAEKDLRDANQPLILIGQSGLLKGKGIDTATLPRETMIVRTMNGVLVLAGEDGGSLKEPYNSSRVRSGTLYAVYDFLQDQLGVRWLWPGETGEVIPKRTTVEVADLNIQETPKLFQRHFRLGMRPPSGLEGANGFPRYNEDRAKLYEQMIAEEGRWAKRMRLGYGERFSYGHAFTQWYDRYFATVPEVFALQENGKRGLPNATQPKEFVKMCVSSPKLLEMLVEQFKKAHAENPDYHYFNAVENDGSAGFCRCDACKAWDHQPTAEERQAMIDLGMDGSEIDRQFTASRRDDLPESLSNRYYRFYNLLAARLKEIDPQVQVVTYAYSRYRYAPVGLPVDPSVVVGLIGFNSYPMSESAHKAEVANFMAWKKLGVQKLFFRPNSFYHAPGHGVPWSGVHQMGDDLNMLIANGMVATDFDMLNGHWSTTAPTYYVLGRMHWDDKMDANSLLDEWCGGFGPAAAPVREYFDMWEQAYIDGMTGPDAEKVLEKADTERGLRRWKGVGLVLTAEQFAKAHELMARARAAAEATGDKELLNRVHVLELGLQHGELMCESARFSIATNFYEQDVDFSTQWPLVQKIFQIREELAELHAHNILWLNSFEIRMHDMFATRVWHDFYKRPWQPVMTPADRKWVFQVDPEGVGETEGWQNKVIVQPKEFNRNPYQHLFYSGWDGLKGMTAWKRANKDREPVNGWYQIALSVPGAMVTPDAALYIPLVVGDGAKVWVNGKLIREIGKDEIAKKDPVVIGLSEAGINPDQEFRLTIKVNSPKGGGLIGPAYIAKPAK